MIQHISRRLQRARPSLVLFGGMLLAISACAPRVAPLTGAAVGEALPSLELEGSRRLVFRWRFADASIILQGEGVARVTAPDSARLDFFVDGGLGGGVAFLLGDSLVVEDAGSVRRLLPPPPLLWATLGRLAVPEGTDTLVTRDGDTLHAEIESGSTWRMTISDDGLTRLARLRGNRLQEYVNRSPEEVLYEHAADRRTLRIQIQRDERVQGFTDDIWIR